VVDVLGCAEAGLSPGLLAEVLGQALAKLGVLASQTGNAVVGVSEVGKKG